MRYEAAKMRRRIRPARTVTGRKSDPNSAKKKKQKDNRVRGKEVTVRDSSLERQVIYGRMKVGGAVTFITTSQESAAYLTTGSEVNADRLVWTARTPGSSGNSITIEIQVTGTLGAVTVTVVGNAITVRARSSGGTPLSTLTELRDAVRADPSAMALVSVSKLDNNENGVVQASATQNLSYGGGRWLHQIITLTGHQINAVEKIFLDGREVTFGASPDARWGTGVWANRVFMSVMYGSSAQFASPDLNAQMPTVWTTDHRQRGCGHVYLILVWDQNVFPEGYPEITFQVKGKECWDPRISQYVWTQNAALIVADFLVATEIGLGIDYANINEASLIAAANICDEAIPLATGGTEPRYQINGVYDAARPYAETLTELLAAMGGGDVVKQGSAYYIYAGAYRAPTLSFTESDIRGAISFTTNLSRSETCNSVRGTYVNPNNDYNETDLPSITNSTYVTEDGGTKLWLDVSLNFVTSASQGQRCLKIELERARQGITLQLPLKLRGLLLQVGDSINLTIAKYGWSNKVFEVRDMEILFESDGILGVDVLLRENAAAIYDWNVNNQTVIDLAPNTNLPSPFSISPPTNLQLFSGTSELFVRGDGTVLSRIRATWTASPTEYVEFGGSYEIQFKRTSDSTWLNWFEVPGVQTTHYLTDVQDGVSYDVRVRALNSLGYGSSWLTVSGHVVLGKTEAPSAVTGFTGVIGDNGIALSWNQIPDLDKSEYEIRRGGVGWSDATFVTRLRASGNSYQYEYYTAGLTPIRIKAIDTSGNYSTFDSTITLDITGPNIINGFTASVVGQSVLLDWTEPLPSSFSVIEYDVYKGDVFATAAKIGTVFGTFHTYLENLGGTFTYWVVAIDIGGNRSTEVSAVATVGVPSTYYGVQNIDILPDYTSDWHNCIIPGEAPAPDEPLNGIILPVENDVVSLPFITKEPQDWNSWFDGNGWTTFQDAIDQGYPEGLQPGATFPGYFTMIHDFGSLVPPGFIQFTYEEQQLGDPTAILTTLSVSTDGVAWTDYVGSSQVFVDSFRYAKVRLDFTGSSLRALSYLTNFNFLVSLERTEETGTVSALAADASGTEVFFDADFYSVEDIQLTVHGTASAFPVLNFAGGINPTSFRVLVFNENGTRVNATVGYRIRGAING